jgi:hypothetical protein
MATVVLNAYSIAFPTITNRIQAVVATQTNPSAIVASLTYNAPHPERIWSFPGLTRTNYIFILNEIDAGGLVLRTLAYFDIVPGDLLDDLFKQEQQIKVGVTPGLFAGLTSFTFDGTLGTQDWRGWEIGIEEYSGVGTLIKNVDYEWDSNTGSFFWLAAGRVFENLQWFTVEFEPQSTGGAISTPTTADFSLRLITANTTLTGGDFGTKLIVEPSGNYLTLTLPSITTVAIGRPLMIETKVAQEFRCVEIIPNGSDAIKFQFGKLYMMMNEALTIYRLNLPSRNEWRVCDTLGNFIDVGRIVSSDLSNVFGKVLLDGSILDKFQYARLYNEVVLRLPISQVVSYDSWSTNQTMYSLANSANPSFANKFHVPNRLGLYEKSNVSPRVVGSIQLGSIGEHDHLMFTNEDVNDVGTPTPTSAVTRAAGLGGNSSYRLMQSANAPSVGKTGKSGTADTNVTNYSTNKYILI